MSTRRARKQRWSRHTRERPAGSRGGASVATERFARETPGCNPGAVRALAFRGKPDERARSSRSGSLRRGVAQSRSCGATSDSPRTCRMLRGARLIDDELAMLGGRVRGHVASHVHTQRKEAGLGEAYARAPGRIEGRCERRDRAARVNRRSARETPGFFRGNGRSRVRPLPCGRVASGATSEVSIGSREHPGVRA